MDVKLGISLRPVLMRDCRDLLEGIRAGGLSGSVPGSDRIVSIGDAEAMVAGLMGRAEAGEEIHFSICLEGRVIGMCAVYRFGEEGRRSARIGFWINASYRRKGYGREAAGLLLGIASGLGVRKAFASTKASNEPSLRLLRSLGFRDEGSQGGQEGERLLSLSLPEEGR